jgi:hypothetical protein
MPAQTRKRQRQEEEQESKTQGQMASAGWIVTESDGSIIRLSKKNNNLVVLLSSSPPSPILSSPTSWSLSAPPSPSPSYALSSLSPTASVREFSSEQAEELFDSSSPASSVEEGGFLPFGHELEGDSISSFSPSSYDCFVCSSTHSRPGDLAEHMRRQHDVEQYCRETAKIVELQMERCPSCLQVFSFLTRHKVCTGPPAANPREKEDGAEVVVQFAGKEWPAGVPKPPSGMPHPNTFAAAKRLHDAVPAMAKTNWVQLLTLVLRNFADECGEDGSEQGMVSSLTALMSLSKVLEKPRGGLKGAKAARNRVMRFFEAVEERDLSSFLTEPEERKISQFEETQERLDQGAVRRATAKLKQGGYFSKATSILKSEEKFNPATVEVLAKLKDKFPEPPSEKKDRASRPCFTLLRYGRR